MPSLFQQLVMGAIFQQAAFMEDEDTVCHPNRGKAMGDEHGTFALGQFDKAAEDLVFRTGVQRGSRFIEAVSYTHLTLPTMIGV